MALAIFDLDETLIHGDCATLWSEQMGRLGWVDPESFMRKNNELMDAYSHGKLRMEDYMDFSLEPLIGRTPSPFGIAAASRFIQPVSLIFGPIMPLSSTSCPSKCERSR